MVTLSTTFSVNKWYLIHKKIYFISFILNFAILIKVSVICLVAEKQVPLLAHSSSGELNRWEMFFLNIFMNSKINFKFFQLNRDAFAFPFRGTVFIVMLKGPGAQHLDQSCCTSMATGLLPSASRACLCIAAHHVDLSWKWKLTLKLFFFKYACLQLFPKPVSTLHLYPNTLKYCNKCHFYDCWMYHCKILKLSVCVVE